MMAKTMFLLFVFIGVLSQSAISGTHWEVPNNNFDGAKFAERYNLDSDKDFHVFYDDSGKMVLALRDGITLPDPVPIFEIPDLTKRNRLAALILKAKNQDLTLAEINEYIKLRDGL